MRRAPCPSLLFESGACRDGTDKHKHKQEETWTRIPMPGGLHVVNVTA